MPMNCYGLLKKMFAVSLSGALVVSLSACGLAGANKGDAVTTESAVAEDEALESAAAVDGFYDSDDDIMVSYDFAADGLALPSHFENMIYPIEAVTMQAAFMGYDYYSQGMSDEEVDSVWYTLACLTSLTNRSGVEELKLATEEDEIHFVKESDVKLFTSALYSQYASGDMELPDIAEDDEYALYEETDQRYGFSLMTEGESDEYDIKIISSEEDEDYWVLTAALYDTELDDDDAICEVNIVVVENTDEDAKALFPYSIQSCNLSEDGIAYVTEEGERISDDEALELAYGYYDADYDYTFVGMEELDGVRYFDFEASGNGAGGRHVLVSEDGESLLGGTKNEDGSWSLEE